MMTRILDLGMNEGAGRSLVDHSGFRHHFSFANTPAWIGGSRGHALNFLAGRSDHCTSPRPSAFLGLNEITICAWVRMPSGVGASAIIAHANDPSQYAFTMSVAASGTRLRIVVSETGSASVSTAKLYDGSLTAFDSFYHHVGFAWSGKQNLLNLYVDGRLDPTPTKTWDFAVTRLHSSTARLVIGALDNPLNFLTGDIASIRGWNRFLSVQEIREDFAQTFIPRV